MTPYYEEAGITIYQGDALAVLPELETCSVDACLTDPPYGLGFMGKEWDHGVPGRETWEAVLRVLKPGAPLLAFGGTRTHHRLMCAIEDAGFEIRDCLMWLYGCLSEDTEILIDGLWEPYHKATAGSIALCYDVRDGEFSRQPVQELVTYDYDDTAYRIESDSTDQIVSRNHRCIIERSGAEVFELAEVAARESEVRVPVLEDLRGLLVSLSMPDTRTGEPQPDVLERVLIGTVVGTTGVQTDDLTANEAGYMCGVRYEGLEAASVAEEDQRSDVLQTLRGSHAGAGVSQALVQGTGSMDSRSGAVLLAEDDRPEQPSVEGRGDVLPQARELRSDQIRSMPTGVSLDGPQGWLRDGTPDSRSEGNGPSSPTNGSGSPRQSRSNRQSAGVDAVSEQPRAQTIRAPRYTRSDLARISPFHYRGVMWCVRVPTGAFVARRNGKIFITGNSGFPKSLDISKAIDKAAGAERTVLSRREQPDIRGGSFQNRQRNGVVGNVEVLDTAPSTDAAKLWSGYGTALKPAYEIIISAQKPYDLRGLCAIMVQRIAKSLCQLAKGAGLSSTSSRAVLEPLDSALWPAARACSSPGDLFDLMDTLPFGSEIPSSLNTGLSWLESLGVILKHGSTFTTEMGSSLTTDLRILNSLSFPNTPGDIIEAAMNPLGTGSSAVIQTAVSIFNGVRAKLKHTLTPSVRGPATFTDGLSGLRPNWEPIILAMKPCEGTFADNALKHGVAGLNIEAGRIACDSRPKREVHALREEVEYHGSSLCGRTDGSLASSKAVGETSLGRWPANLLLDEDWIPVRYLRYNVDSGTSAAIKEYFDGYCGLQGLRQGDRDVSEQKVPKEVLQSGVLRQGAQSGQSGVRPSDVRQASFAGIHREDEGQPGRGGPDRSERGQLERGPVPHVEGLRDAISLRTVGEGSGACDPDANEESGLRAGASAGYGSEVGPSTDAAGNSTSQEWHQGRQPTAQSGDGRQRHAQDDSPVGSSGTSETPARKRGIEVATLEVLESDIPSGWLRHFGYTGKAVRMGSAAMLDEQSGQSTTPSKVTRGKRQMAFGMGEQRDVPCYGDSGGASRFFYCAKASKSERNAGLEGMPQSNNMRVNAPCKDEAEKHATQHGNTHPTVKPLKLCEYLARMILPPERDTQRRLLVPFSGSGSEMLGALRAGWDEVVGIEMNADYCEIAWRRIGAPPPLIGSEDPPRPATDEQMALLGWQDALKEEAISGGGK